MKLPSWLEYATRCKWVVLTGGEPALQLDANLVDALHAVCFRYRDRDERNNRARPARDRLGHGSPKPGDELRVSYTDEIRYVIRDDDPIPSPPVPARNYILLPSIEGDQLDTKDLE